MASARLPPDEMLEVSLAGACTPKAAAAYCTGSCALTKLCLHSCRTPHLRHATCPQLF